MANAVDVTVEQGMVSAVDLTFEEGMVNAVGVAVEAEAEGTLGGFVGQHDGSVVHYHDRHHGSDSSRYAGCCHEEEDLERHDYVREAVAAEGGCHLGEEAHPGDMVPGSQMSLRGRRNLLR